MLNFLTQSFSNWWQPRPAGSNYPDASQPEAGQNDTTRPRPEMTEFLQTYIYPGGKHPDGTPLSSTERRSAAELTDIVNRLTTPDDPAVNTVKPLKMHGWQQMTTGLLYLYSGCHQTVAPSPARSTGREFHSLTQSTRASANMHPHPKTSPQYLKTCHNPALHCSMAPTMSQSTQSIQTATIEPKHNLLAWEEYTDNSFIVRYYETDREGVTLFRAAVRNPINYLKREAKVVLDTLYASVNDSPDKPRVIFTLQKMPGIATVHRSYGQFYMNFNSDYIKEFFALHGHDKLALEVRGVMLHELAHVYQLRAQSIHPGSDNRTSTALTEGLADAVRILNELPTRSATPGGHYMNGYTQGGFFFVWIKDNYDPEFIRKLNRSTQDITPWSFNAAIKHILGQQYDVDELWQDYQAELHAVQCRGALASPAPKPAP